MKSTGSVSFTRNPLAPARIARATYSSSSKVVTMTMCVPASAGFSTICSVAHSPSPSGMRMSMSTTSGRCCGHQSDRLGAGAGLTDHLDVRLGLEQAAEARSDELLVVRDRDPDHGDSRTGLCCGMRTRISAPPEGERPVSRVPPSSSARSRIPRMPRLPSPPPSSSAMPLPLSPIVTW